MTPAASTWAMVLDHFKGLTPADLAALTPYQLHELYLHERDERGGILLPKAQKKQQKPLSEEQHVAAYLRVARGCKFPAEVIEAQVARIRARHARKAGGDAGAGN